MADLEVFGFETSNNMKVRIALNYKDLRYVFHSVDPADREQILAMTGQPLTPVLRHGEVVLFDSGAIIRYLETAFPDAPRLFSPERQTVVAIENWENFGRSRLLGPLVKVVNARLQGNDDPAIFDASATEFRASLLDLADGLGDSEWLVDDRLTAADIFVAPVAFRGVNYGFCDRETLAPAVLDWCERVMALDTPPA